MGEVFKNEEQPIELLSTFLRCILLEQLQWELLKMGCQMPFCNLEQCFGTFE